MKSINSLLNKYCYNEINPNQQIHEGNSFFHEEAYPFNQYHPPGMINDKEDSKSENYQKDGKDFEEFKEFKILNRIKKLRKLLRKKRKNPTLQPTPFYSSVYGYTGLEGANSSPLEYYSGSISEEPGAITNNPYNTPYQSAQDRSDRIKIRSMIFNDLCKYT